MAITRVVGRDGRATTFKPRCERELDPEVPDATADSSGVGKTGTTDGYTNAWIAGFTPDLAATVSIGDPRGSQRYKLTGVTLGGHYYGSVQGASLPGPIWNDTMRAALRSVAPTQFTPVDTARFGGCDTGCAPDRRNPDDATTQPALDEAGQGLNENLPGQ
ncbi:hypothetical protein [Nonomuraea sp. KM90]|uniref:hypothetical protein n=1 Tax=Nonomuraea sp. KM90 TaxID=3457428 RepID=UPI003FCD28BB